MVCCFCASCNPSNIVSRTNIFMEIILIKMFIRVIDIPIAPNLIKAIILVKANYVDREVSGYYDNTNLSPSTAGGIKGRWQCG